MRGFDLYRMTLAYLGIIFALCALVVFDPLARLWPAGGPEIAAPLPVGPLHVAPQIAPQIAPPQEAAGLRQGDAVPGMPVDPAEIVAALVAQSFGAGLAEEVGEGDASPPSDVGVDRQEALVAAGSDVAYTVAPGDSLGSLALRFYGDSALAPLIHEANRGLLASPDRLRVGQVLIIPGRS